jgi:hypothetical protein
MAPANTTEELIALMKTGDEDAAWQLAERYLSFLKERAHFSLESAPSARPVVDTDDLSQSGAERIREGEFNRSTTRDEFRVALKRWTRNRAVDAARKGMVRKSVLLSDDSAAINPDDLSDLRDEMLRDLTLEQYTIAVDLLDEKSIAIIAEAHGITQHAVKLIRDRLHVIWRLRFPELDSETQIP